MGDTSIELWLNKYQYYALRRILTQNGTDIETVMQEKLSELYLQTVPEQERTEINGRIEADRFADEQHAREMRTFSVYHITENGAEHYFESDYDMELMHVAWQLRKYLRGEFGPRIKCFAAVFDDAIPIDAQKFEEHVRTRMDNTGKIAGVFDIDFDKQEISGVHIMDGWKTYSIKDASTAAYHAYRGSYRTMDQRWSRFLEYLDGKELTQEQSPQMLSMQ